MRVEFNGRELEAKVGTTIFGCADQLGERIPSSCSRQGICRECVVEVEEGLDLLVPRSAEERHLGDPFRLACKARLASDTGTLRVHTFRRGALRIEESGERTAPLPGKHLEPAVKRRGSDIYLDDQPIGPYRNELLGLAIDIGTTTVVVRLVDLETGLSRASSSFENPQRFAGTDVMSRIRFEYEHPEQLLRKTLTTYLADVIRSFPCDNEQIYEATVVGNSTMRDLFFGLDVGGLGQKPFRSVSEYAYQEGKCDTTALVEQAASLGLPIHPLGRVYGLPLIASHVGADAAACLLAVDFLREERPVLLMDIGTNTELIVGNRHRVLAASCPAGPAFEGGHVKCGMPALEGAIEEIALLDGGGSVEIKTIGDIAPEGLCGSGLVDLLGELRRTGWMNDRGRLSGQRRFNVDSQKRIFLDDEDISNLAQAKGANAAGLKISARRYGIGFDEFAFLYLCGAFARHINLEAARRIGLIPEIDDSRVIQLGNAAIEGATKALISVSLRRQLEQFVKKIDHIELETDECFFDSFVDGCLFNPLVGAGLAKVSKIQ